MTPRTQRLFAALGVATVLGLTGPLLPAAAAMAVADPAAPAAPAADAARSAPEWAHDTVTDGRATAWVERDVSIDAGSTLRMRGTGWTNLAGTQGSTIAVKLNAGPLTQYARPDDSVISHPSAGGEATIWALIAPENPTGHPAVHTVDAAGNFDFAIDLPTELTAGQEFSVRFQSGLFATGDTARTLTTAPLVVGGVPFEGGDTEVLPTCVPSTPEPTVSVAETASVGGTVQVTGTGWCRPAAASGGSRIAIKIDEGTFSHPTTAIHSNRTIWALVDADDTTGDWQIEMQLPDGTEATSLPAFTEGAHTLRLLTGSLIDGDAARSMRTAPFVVGEYAPGVLPQPIDIDSGALASETRGGVTVEYVEAPAPGAWRVTVPGGNEGDWVFVNAYAGSSSRTPFPEWHRLDAELSVQLSLADTLLTPGELSVTVQSGGRGRVGELLGWAPITIVAEPTPEPSPAPAPEPVVPAVAPPAQAPVRAAVVTSAPTQMPATVPEAPVRRASQLTEGNSGTVSGVVDSGVVTVSAPGREANEWVYAYLYTGADVRPIGWVQLDERTQLRVDITGLPEGNHKVALVDTAGELIGWAAAAVGETAPAVLRADTTSSAADRAQRDRAPQAESAAMTAAYESPAGVSLPLDMLLIAGAAVVVVGAVATALVVRAKRAKEQP